MLLLDHPIRLSTDIDIIVDPGTDVESYIDQAGTIFPFLRKEEDIRKGRNNIEKRHFKFIYYSPVRQREFYILLDIVFMEAPYDRVVTKPIRNDLLVTAPEDLVVTMPTMECILGDKLTAFAPHTTGVLLGEGKELEIAKQMFDVATLAERMQDQKQFRATYDRAVREELAFRGLKLEKEKVLKDTIRACISIISRGEYDKEAFEADYWYTLFVSLCSLGEAENPGRRDDIRAMVELTLPKDANIYAAKYELYPTKFPLKLDGIFAILYTAHYAIPEGLRIRGGVPI